MNRDKKLIAIVVLSIAVVFLGIGNVSFFLLYSQDSEPIEEKLTLVVGVSSGPSDIDPLNADEDASYNVIRQVAEGLYMYDYTDPDLARIPMLALDEGIWEDNLTLTITLRDDVWFHDYEKFNATAVKWNFDRLLWFSNASGTLNTTLLANYPLFKLPNGTLILDEVIVNSDYNVTFKLNTPYPPFKELLCHTSCFMLSPKSTPRWKYIDILTGELIGTGSFIYNSFIVDKEVKLSRWGWYWRRSAFFEELIFSIIEDSTTRNNAMLNHDIDYLTLPHSSVYPTFDADITITLSDPIVGVDYNYLKLNNEYINKTWREAISYAINYSYIIEELQYGSVYRANGPLAPNFPGYNASIQAATYDLAYARSIVQSMGLAIGLVADASTTGVNANAWRALNLQSWNYTYNLGNNFREDLGVLLLDNLDLIGINVIDPGMSWADFIYRAYGWDQLYRRFYNGAFHWLSWIPDYLDPINTFLSLFSNSSIPDEWGFDGGHNLAFVNDSLLEQKLTQALSETNGIARSIIYSDIQHYLAEELFPHVFGFHSKMYFVHSADLKNVPYNPLRAFYAWPIYRA